MNPFWCLQTGRLVMRPVWGGDLADLRALKADPRAFAIMLGGVRSWQRSAEELADDICFWGRYGVGMWTVRDRGSNVFRGIAGIMPRPDGRGMSLRFALQPAWQGRGYASEAAAAALRFAHERAGIERIVAVARETNLASRQVLGGIGMVVCDGFVREGDRLLVYESVRRQMPGQIV
jgi:RimJ/RimL family protein N-acetyltransferase